MAFEAIAVFLSLTVRHVIIEIQFNKKFCAKIKKITSFFVTVGAILKFSYLRTLSLAPKILSTAYSHTDVNDYGRGGNNVPSLMPRHVLKEFRFSRKNMV